MANILAEDITISALAETKKQRKKQAKREAKIMLKVGQAKKDVLKAERRVAKAQAELETCKAYLQKMEQKLVALRAPHEESPNGQLAFNSADQSSERPEMPEEPAHTIHQDITTSTGEMVNSPLADQIPAPESSDDSHTTFVSESESGED